MSYTIAYIGNFGPPHSTENHVAAALRNLGHAVDEYQENDPESWVTLQTLAVSTDADSFGALPDLVLWTRTGWDPPIPRDVQLATIDLFERRSIPVVGFHLDRWWGLDREHQIDDEAFFASTRLFTADGGNAEGWIRKGIEHRWSPPGVLDAETRRVGDPDRFPVDVAFVGSWKRYHREWPYRKELVLWLRANYGRSMFLAPRAGFAPRGQDLADVYAGAKVVVGDSCLARGIGRYWSDRVPETIGRGGVLIHPRVAGLDEHFVDGEHLVTYDVGDWAGLKDRIDYFVENPDAGREMAEAGRAHVQAHHTYEVRLGWVLDELRKDGLL